MRIAVVLMLVLLIACAEIYEEFSDMKKMTNIKNTLKS